MAKFYGAVGFGVTEKTGPGLWETHIVERNYYGDWQRNYRRLDSPEKVNDDIEFSNTISIVADPYAYENFYAIRYIVLFGKKLKVKGVEVNYPRLSLTIGGEYNGEQS